MESINESVLLENAIRKNEIVNRHLEKSLNSQNVSSKTRVSEINNQSFREKQEMVNKLIYIIYFMLFSIGLGISVTTGMISFKTLNILFVVSLVILAMALLRMQSFWKTYGDLSMKAAKGTTKEIIQLVAPQKKCPKRCVKKDFNSFKESFRT